MNRKDESLDAVWEREWLAGNKAGYRCLNKWPSFRWRAAFVYEVPSGNFVQLNSSSRDVFLNQWTYLLWAQFELRDYHGYLMYYDWAIEVRAKSWLEIFFYATSSNGTESRWSLLKTRRQIHYNDKSSHGRYISGLFHLPEASITIQVVW